MTEKRNSLKACLKINPAYIKIMKEFAHNIYKKLQNLHASTYEIAAGVACGVAVSFTPFVGLHSVLAVGAAFLFRASIAAALIGTLFGNPWTFPFIWAAVLFLGDDLSQSSISQTHIDFEKTFSAAFSMIKNLNFSGFAQDVWPILYPMIIGSIPFCLLSWIIAYIITEKLITKEKQK